MKCLLKRGCCVNSVTKKGNSALHIASLGKFMLFIKLFNFINMNMLFISWTRRNSKGVSG